MGAEAAPLSPSCTQDIHVLVVDDCPVDRKIVEKLLLKNGTFKVTAVDGGKKALEVLGLNEKKDQSPSINRFQLAGDLCTCVVTHRALLFTDHAPFSFSKDYNAYQGCTVSKYTAQEFKIDMILTDYCMPQMNGYDLLKVLKEHNCLKSIPVVLMSSENDPQRISSCHDAGAKEFILKPLRPVDIQRMRSYVGAITPTPKTGKKRKIPLDVMTENSNGSERGPHLARVTVA